MKLSWPSVPSVSPSSAWAVGLLSLPAGLMACAIDTAPVEPDFAQCSIYQSSQISDAEGSQHLGLAKCPEGGTVAVIYDGPTMVDHIGQGASRIRTYRPLAEMFGVSHDTSLGNCARDGDPLEMTVVISAVWEGRDDIAVGRGLESLLRYDEASRSLVDVDLQNVVCYQDQP